MRWRFRCYFVKRAERDDLDEEVESTNSDKIRSTRYNERADDDLSKRSRVLGAYQTHAFTCREGTSEEAIDTVDDGGGDLTALKSNLRICWCIGWRLG
jgi:hypothetical protein